MSEPKIIYVVTRGEYSDYCICSLHDSKADAQAEVNRLNEQDRWDSARIEEYFLNPSKGYPDNETYHLFVIAMRKNGNVTYSSDEGVPSAVPDSERFKAQYTGNTYADAWAFRVVARNLEHAIKIVNEKRVQYIANNDWPVEELYPAAKPSTITQ